MKVYELAEKCGYECYGSNRDIVTISFADSANEDSIAIINSVKQISKTRANCVLTMPTMLKTDKTLVFINDPIQLAAVKVAQILIDHGDVKNYGIPRYRNVSGYFIGENVSVGNHTIISPNVYIGDDVQIGEACVIEPGVTIHSGTVIENNVYIATGSSIGANSFCHYYDNGLQEFSGIGCTILGSNVRIGSNTIVQRGTFSNTVIGSGSKIGNLVDIGHDVCIGENCKIVSQTGIAGNVVIGDYVQIFGQVGIVNGVHLGDYATVMAKSLVTKNIANGKSVSGLFGREHKDELGLQAKIRRL